MELPWYEILLRLSLAAVCGLLVGMEREHRHRPAGIKTHVLVCIGAALVSLIQIKMVDEAIRMIQMDSTLAQALKSDYGRLGAQVISGIGFLGAGTILHNKETIKGLTTAATLWLVACVGLAVGMGYYLISIMTISLAMIVLVILHLAQNFLIKERGVKHIDVLMLNKHEAMNFINNYCIAHNIIVQDVELSDVSSNMNVAAGSHFTYGYAIVMPRTTTIERVLMDLQMNENIASAVICRDVFSE